MEAWIASEAVSREELDSWTDIAASEAGRPEGRTPQLINEWAWAMPLVGEEDDILCTYADHPDPDEVAAALRSWPDQALEVLEGMTPRQALQRQQAEAEVEMLIRHLEYDADTRQLERWTRTGCARSWGC